MKKIFLAMLASAAVFSAASCGQHKNTPLKEGSVVDYSLSFFKNAVMSQDKDENVFVSPYSAGVAMSMLSEGAEGQTKTELSAALNGLDFTAYTPAADTAVDVRTANSAWLRKGFTVKSGYSDCLSRKYGADVSVRDFSDPGTVDAINNWCSEKTEGKIPSIVDAIGQDMVMFLVNALYFKAPWEKEFNGKLTSDDTFYGSKKEGSVPFMYAKDVFQYAEYQGAQMVSLPYSGGKYSMLVMLPSPEMSVDDVLPYLNEETYLKARESMSEKRISLKMPKFKLETTTVLNDTFAALGVRRVFSGAAELGGISSSGIAVDQIKQKCFVEVNEAGSEAAAVTSVGVRLTSVNPPAAVPSVVVDRPFLFAITDNATGNFLFTGKVMNL